MVSILLQKGSEIWNRKHQEAGKDRIPARLKTSMSMEKDWAAVLWAPPTATPAAAAAPQTAAARLPAREEALPGAEAHPPVRAETAPTAPAAGVHPIPAAEAGA